MSLPLRLLRQALSSLWAFRSYALLMMIGLIIGIASLTVIQEIGEGARHRVQVMMEGFGFGADAFYISAGGGRMGMRHRFKRARNLTPEDAQEIRRLQGVAWVVPHKGVARTRISAGGKHMASRVVGVTPNWASIRNWRVSQGRFVSQEDEDRRARVAVLGATPVRELFGGKSPLGKRIRIGNTPFLVVGVLQTKGSSGRGRDRDDRVMVPLATASKRLSRDPNYSGMRVNLVDPAQRDQVTQEVAELLRGLHKLPRGVPDDFMIITPDQLLSLITRQSQAMVAMLSFISVVSLFVSGIVIMNIMLVAISERSFEIGVRRAVGARRRDILGQILMESILVALAGGLCGLGLGLVLSWLATLILEVPTAFSPLGFSWALGFSVAVGLLFGLVPARKAAALTPMEALR